MGLPTGTYLVVEPRLDLESPEQPRQDHQYTLIRQWLSTALSPPPSKSVVAPGVGVLESKPSRKVA